MCYLLHHGIIIYYYTYSYAIYITTYVKVAVLLVCNDDRIFSIIHKSSRNGVLYGAPLKMQQRYMLSV